MGPTLAFLGEYVSATEHAGEEPTGRFLGDMPLAALTARNALHDLIDVLAAAGPGGFLTGLAGYGSAHGGAFR